MGISSQPAAGQEPLLALHDVTVRFAGLTALSGVALAVRPNSVVGVIGPNGAGKTTLFNVICGLIRPQRGQLLWRGELLRDHRPDQLARLGIARTLQGLGLFAGMTVIDNVMVGATRHAGGGALSGLLGMTRAARDERELRGRAREVLKALGIADLGTRLPGSLPYGTQKRVALARALVAEPELVLLDEPASGLSTAELDDLVGHVLGLTGRMAVVLVEHHMDLVMRICDHIVVLNFGEVISAGSPEHVRRDPVVTEAYLGRPGEEAAGA